MDETKPLEDALARYEEMIQHTPTASVCGDKGKTLLDLKRYEEALLTFEHAIELDPNLPLAHYDKGVAFAHLQRNEEALLAYEQVIQQDPNYVRAYVNKGGALIHLKRYEEAVLAFEQAIQQDPTSTNAYKYKGVALGHLERYNDAMDAYNKTLQLAPTDKSVSETIDKLKLYQERLLNRKVNRIYAELWRVYYAILIVASGFTMALLSFRLSPLFALGIAILTIGAALLCCSKHFDQENGDSKYNLPVNPNIINVGIHRRGPWRVVRARARLHCQPQLDRLHFQHRRQQFLATLEAQWLDACQT